MTALFHVQSPSPHCPHPYTHDNTLLPSFVLSPHREVTASLVRRAEAAGFSALVLTVDAPYFGIRRDDIRNQFTLPPHLR